MMDSGSDIVPAAITEDVQTRLNTLNYASSLINSNEANLDKARQDYQSLLSEATQVLSTYSKKLKSSIEKSRPYYENQVKKKKLLEDLQQNSEAYSTVWTEHDKAVSILKSYSIDVAKFVDGDESKLEVVNNAVQRVNKTKVELNDLKKKHKDIISQCTIIEENLRVYRSRMGMAIRKSQPYFDMQDIYNRKMAVQCLQKVGLWTTGMTQGPAHSAKDAKQVIDRLTVEVKSAKLLYAQTMNNLEAISNRIHESRRLGHWLNSPLTSPRTHGVGAEVSNSSSEREEVAATPTMLEAGGTEEVSASLSPPSSPRHTPPGQADTDTEADSEVGGGPAFFGSSYVATLRKSAGNPLLSDVVSALHSCSMGPAMQTTQSKDEQTDSLALTVRSQHSRSQSL
ncbi:SH3 domain-binding protein [Echinococcus granulosus]|uniref:SH3 domain-binding protein n=1 Tax=Echinococcus granulosus TaxID=6210 RepID=W6U8D1_ECHGR|nr:SH3 domain-binding protein [Echinococcus granulosus]EUB57463.1 SH3 domain-binding protein [Echinococcus granulosus]